jgi:AAA domain
MSGRKTFSLKTDVDLLEEKAKEIGNVRLIIVDPISAYMGGSDGNGNVETREVLEPLADMANRLRIAVVAVTHLNKGGAGGNQSALNRFAGSIAFVAAARAAFAVIEDPEDSERRLLLQAKNNLGKPCKGLAFRLEQRLIQDDIVSSNVMFEGEHVSQSIDEALTASESRGGNKGQNSSKEDVTEFLTEILANGPVDVLEVESQARAATLLADDKRLRQNKAFRDAREALGVLATREGFGPGARYVLSLSGTPCAPKNTMCAPFQNRAHMDIRAHMVRSGGGMTESGRLAELDRCFVLTPYNPDEALTLQRAAARAGRSPGTIRNWCESEGLGRRIGGKWCVSKVALEMYLDGEAHALEQYLQGDRSTPDVVSYFKRFGLLAQKPVNSRLG